jgi:hypothetical protein
MKPLQKTLAASGVAAALVGLTGPANAIIEGAPGEALLVPFALFQSQQDFADPGLLPPFDNIVRPFIPEINTIVQVTVPSAVGFDTVPAFFTAPNSTPTNANVRDFPREPALGPQAFGDIDAFQAGVHLYAFNEDSVEVYNTTLPTSPEDLITINWGDIVTKRAPELDGEKVYLVITNEKEQSPLAAAFYPRGEQSAAQFAMMGDAYMVWNPVPVLGIGLIDTKIPVLPMSDGEDFVGSVPTTNNNVVFDPGTGDVLVSPLASGIRTGLSDGFLGDYTLFDLTMSNRFAPTIHVIWVDQNINQTVTQFIFDDNEAQCSQPIPITDELNVYWTSPSFIRPNWGPDGNPNQLGGGNAPTNNNLLSGVYLPWIDLATDLCYPGDQVRLVPENLGELFELLDSTILYPGFVRFRINEYEDNNLGLPESAAVAFSIQLQLDVLDEDGALRFQPQLLPVETALAHERGSFEP